MNTISRFLGWGNKVETTEEADTDEPWGFQVLYEDLDPLFDIIAIHGLDGHREGTWTHENGVFWLRDLLACDPSFSRSRIMTYGYDSRTHVSKGLASLQTLPGHSQELLQHLSDLREDEGTTRRPIFFVVHSLGGVVLKSALVNANLSDKNESKKGIKLSTFGILFIGTPHEGSGAVPLGQSALKIAQVYYSINDNAVKELGEHSQWLERETGLFNTIRDSFRIRNCYETIPTRLRHGPSVVADLTWIVPKWSAAPLAWDTEACGINRDHITMTKFSSARDQAYQRVEQIMKLMIRDAVATVKKNWDGWNASQPAQIREPIERTVNSIQDLEALLQSCSFDLRSNLPLKNDSFVGRDEERKMLRQKLAGLGSNRSMVLFGPGGVGKTQLALKYCWDHKADYSTILWFNAANINVMRTSFLTVANKIVAFYKSQLASYSVPTGLIAQYLELKDLVHHDGTVVAEEDHTLDCVADAVKLWLDIEGNHRWLAVFDSYEPDNFPKQCRIDRYLPRARSGTTMVTTQRRIGLQNGSVMEVPCFSGEESLQLLLYRSQKDYDDLVETEKEQAALISKELGQFPLAIDQAGAYIFQEDESFASYLKLYHGNKKDLLQKKPLSFDSQYDECVFTTWETSYQLLEKNNKEAAELLIACSFFFNVDIPLQLFQRGYNKTERQVYGLFSEILSFSLARRHDIGSYSIHTLIHIWARQRFDLNVQQKYAQKCVKILADAVRRESEYDWTVDDIAFERRIRIHADTVLEISSKWSLHDLGLEQWVNLGSLYESYGKYDDAERLYKLALNDHDREQSKPSQVKAATTLRLAKLYRLQSHPTLAIPLCRQYLETNSDLSDVATARVNIQLAVAIHDEGQYEEAEELTRSGIAVLEKELGLKKIEVLSARNELASTLLRLKRYDEAKDEYQYVLEQLREVVGMENPFTMRTLQNLARYYNLRGDYKQALPMFEQAFELRRRALGLGHPSTLRTWHNLAYTHCLLGRMEEAENMYASVVAAKEKTLGPCHWDTLNAMKGLADIYRKTDQISKAQELYKKTLKKLGNGTDSRRRKMIDDIQKSLEADSDGNEDRSIPNAIAPAAPSYRSQLGS